MSELSRGEIEELARQKLEEKSYSEIRADLAEAGVDRAEISEVIRQVDELVLKTETEQKHTDKARQWYRVGMAFAIVGILLSIAFKADVFLSGFPPWLVYTPFFAGILLMFYGRIQLRKHPEPYKKGPGRIRRKRPYK